MRDETSDPLTVQVEVIIAEDDIDVFTIFILDVEVRESSAVWDELFVCQYGTSPVQLLNGPESTRAGVQEVFENLT